MKKIDNKMETGITENDNSSISPADVVSERMYLISEKEINAALQMLVEIPWKSSNPVIQVLQAGLKLQE